MTPQDFDYLRKLLRERSGLVLSAEKQYLAESRLLPVARKHGLGGLAELVGKLKAAACAALAVEVVEAMTTNEILLLPRQDAVRAFPRHHHAGAAGGARAREAHPHLVHRRVDRAGALFAGDEPEGASGRRSPAGAWRSSPPTSRNEVLEKAKAGIYNQFEVQRGLPIQSLVKFFTQVGEAWQIAPEIRAMVQFRPLNLLNDFSALGTFDLVFCRNVLIYFDQDTKIDVLNRLARQMPADGFLMLGAAETVVGLTEAFKPMADRRGLYVPNAPAVKPAPAGNVLKFALKA